MLHIKEANEYISGFNLVKKQLSQLTLYTYADGIHNLGQLKYVLLEILAFVVKLISCFQIVIFHWIKCQRCKMLIAISSSYLIWKLNSTFKYGFPYYNSQFNFIQISFHPVVLIHFLSPFYKEKKSYLLWTYIKIARQLFLKGNIWEELTENATLWAGWKCILKL